MVFPVVMYGCETWTIKETEHWRIDAFELWCWRRLLRVPWTARRSNQSILKEISAEYSLEGLMAVTETPILWPHDAKNWLLRKDPDAGKDWREEEKGLTEDEMVGWHCWLNGHESEQALGVGDGQGGLVCCSPWGCKESDTTERLNWTDGSLSSVQLFYVFMLILSSSINYCSYTIVSYIQLSKFSNSAPSDLMVYSESFAYPYILETGFN